jgi:hypothetical protein
VQSTRHPARSHSHSHSHSQCKLNRNSVARPRY